MKINTEKFVWFASLYKWKLESELRGDKEILRNVNKVKNKSAKAAAPKKLITHKSEKLSFNLFIQFEFKSSTSNLRQILLFFKSFFLHTSNSNNKLETPHTQFSYTWLEMENGEHLKTNKKVAVAICIKAVNGYENWNIEWINLLIKKKTRITQCERKLNFGFIQMTKMETE